MKGRKERLALYYYLLLLSNGPSKNEATQRQGMQKGVNCDIVETVRPHWLKHENLLSFHQVAHLFLSSLLIDSLLVKTIPSFNAAKFLCGKHGKL